MRANMPMNDDKEYVEQGADQKYHSDEAGYLAPDDQSDPIYTCPEEELRSLFAVAMEHAQETLWDGKKDTQEVIAYLGERGFTGADIRSLGLGFCRSASEMRERLAELGYNQPPEDDQTMWAPVIPWDELEGYILVPAHGGDKLPPVLYGHWPGEIPPEGCPQPLVLPAENLEVSVAYLERAREAGHRDLVAVPEIMAAALLQARGDTRVVTCLANPFSRLQMEIFQQAGIGSMVLCPDGEEDENVLASVESLYGHGIAPFVAPHLPDQVTMEEFVLDLDAWNGHVNQATPGLVYLAGLLLGEVTPESPPYQQEMAIRKVVEEMRELLQEGESARYKSEIIQLLADRTGKKIRDLSSLFPPKTRPKGTGTEETEQRQSQATQLMEMALEKAQELFLSPADDAYILIPEEHRTPCYLVRSTNFQRWLRNTFMQQEGKAPNSESIHNAVEQLDAAAANTRKVREVYLRLAEHEGAIYWDLGTDRWEVVKITPQGWNVVIDCPIPFVRGRGSQPLPAPIGGGSLELLKQFINVKQENQDDWALLVGFIVGCFNPDIPYPILALHGEQGSAKSTAARVLKRLIDDNEAALRKEPRQEEDVMVMAKHNHLLCFDNLSKIAPWLSDLLCGLSTGTGHGKRKLYSDDDECILVAKRPIVLNGIGELVERSDLLDRAILVSLEKLSKPRPEKEFWGEFESHRPQLMGAICDAVSMALRKRADIKLDPLPRMADFAIWVQAAEPALGWTEGTFLAAYRENRMQGHRLALETDGVAELLLGFARALPVDLNGERNWEGTATKLRESLEKQLDLPESRMPPKEFPRTPRQLSETLRRIVPDLRSVQVEVDFKKVKGKRLIIVTNLQGDAQGDAPVPQGDAPVPQGDAQGDAPPNNNTTGKGASTAKTGSRVTQGDAETPSLLCPRKEERKREGEKERRIEREGEEVESKGNPPSPCVTLRPQEVAEAEYEEKVI